MIFRNGRDTDYLVQNSKVRTEFRGLKTGYWHEDSLWTTDFNPVSYNNSGKCKILAPYELVEWQE